MKGYQQTIRGTCILKVIVFICFLCNKGHSIKTLGFQAGLSGSLQHVIGCPDGWLKGGEALSVFL